MIDTSKVTAFMTTHARLLDRRRADIALGRGDADAALSALAAYRNPDGGFGWGSEPDLRAPSSQPGGALHAFEVLEEIAPVTSPMATELCDWLAGCTLRGGGLPFALPIADPAGSAPFWVEADPSVPSLQITAVVAGIAHRVARHDRAVADHPWLEQATAYCMDAIAALEKPGFVLEFNFALQLLDAVHDSEPRAEPELRRLAAFIPASGTMPVPGGAPGEALRPLDFSPRPDRPMRALLDPQVVRDDLDRLEAEQGENGGWNVDFAERSPAGALDWRGWATVRAIRLLIDNGRLDPATL